jgi:uncharacterized protein with HEPN domain
MPLNERDTAYLWDMLDAAKTIREFVSDLSLGQYLRDRKLQLAIERELEIIGEAAGRLSKEYHAAHGQIPWRNIIGMRNVLAHEYGEVKQESLWKVVTENIPVLISFLEPQIGKPA